MPRSLKSLALILSFSPFFPFPLLSVCVCVCVTLSSAKKPAPLSPPLATVASLSSAVSAASSTHLTSGPHPDTLTRKQTLPLVTPLRQRGLCHHTHRYRLSSFAHQHRASRRGCGDGWSLASGRQLPWPPCPPFPRPSCCVCSSSFSLSPVAVLTFLPHIVTTMAPLPCSAPREPQRGKTLTLHILLQ